MSARVPSASPWVLQAAPLGVMDRGEPACCSGLFQRGRTGQRTPHGTSFFRPGVVGLLLDQRLFVVLMVVSTVNHILLARRPREPVR
jgi:hypothetical protein